MALLTLLSQLLFGKLPFCSIFGAIVGLTAGTFMGLALPAIVPGGLTAAGILEAGLMLAVAGWIAAMVILGAWARYGAAQLWAPGLVNAALTAVLTVWANVFIGIPALAAIIGLLVGIVVGLILCRFCPPLTKGGAANGR